MSALSAAKTLGWVVPSSGKWAEAAVVKAIKVYALDRRGLAWNAGFGHWCLRREGLNILLKTYSWLREGEKVVIEHMGKRNYILKKED